MTETAPTPASELIEVTGSISTLYCQRPTFSAGVMLSKGRTIRFSVKGYVTVGEPTTLRGKWEEDARFGKQFKATEVVYKLPADLDGLGQWLSWYGNMIGPVKARKMIDEFGMDLMRLVVEDAGQVAAMVGVPIKSIEQLAERWVKHSGKVASASQLAAWGLTQRETEALIGRFGANVVTLLKDDPYSVIGKVDGFGWKTTDAMAAKIGIVGDDPRRLRGAVTAIVREKYDEGSTAIATELACSIAADKIGTEPGTAARVQETIDVAVGRNQLKRLGGKDGPTWLATPYGLQCEQLIWDVLRESQDSNPCVPAALDESLRILASMYSRLPAGGATYELDEGQINAVYNAARFRVSVVTGGAGSGKTLVARAITKLFTDDDVPVMLAAPTGKAARRLEEVIGRDASTIHRLLEYQGGEGRFMRNKDNPLPRGVVIVDEASMLDAQLGHSLLQALGEKTAMVLIGDPNQLPPVGPGALLRDVLAHELVPVMRLEKCHRQAGTLKRNCAAILKGEVEPWANDEVPSPWVVSRQCNTIEKIEKVIADLYLKYLPEWGYDPIRDTQIMTAKHDGMLGTRRLNIILQRLHQRSLGNELGEILEDEHERRPAFYVGDKVIHTVNNYELEVMNGSVGVITHVEPRLVVEYDSKSVTYPKNNEGEVSLGYCLTPHKCQGSEYPCAVTIVPKAHSFMQHRSWLYTAVTRAKKTAVIIGDADGIRRAAERVDTDKRVTLLQVFAEHEETRA